MALLPGTRFGVYEVTAQIGEGGMGQVYRATDTNLKRQVAIKILPPALAADDDRLARFQREAEVLASLNHPNIATIYGLEDAAGVKALVMELVEGEDLSRRIARGAIPLDEALPIAKQVADALEAAHEQGIIHRDLKPANIKMRADGTVKVLDFGLAKATDAPATMSASASMSPTLTSPAMMTGMGVILGTAAYMSPEQARGTTADRRVDLWAFGVVLWEMLTGKRPFEGATVSDTLASVLKTEPDWNALATTTPPPIRRLLRRCLTKDRRLRLQAIGEARIVIDDVLLGNTPDAVPAKLVSGRSALPIAVISITAIIGALTGVTLSTWLRDSPEAPHRVMRLMATDAIAPVNGALAISRDGSQLAFVGGPRNQIYVRAIDQFDARPLSGTDGASLLCFSPDGQSISFVVGERGGAGIPSLKRVSTSGGPPQKLTDVRSIVGPPAQSWASTDDIFFTDNGVLMRIASRGGKPQTLATPDPKAGEIYYVGPQLLPDGLHVLVALYSATQGLGRVRVLTLNVETGDTKVILDQAGIPRYLPTGAGTGYLVYYEPSSASLIAVPFDPTRLEMTGSPAPVVEGILSNRGPFGIFSISESGTLVYVAGTPPLAGSSLVWVDRNGIEQLLPAPPRGYNSGARLSPDGQRIAVSIGSNETEDVWVYDIDRGTLNRITSEGNGANPIWSPDAKSIFFERRPSGGAAVLSVPADGSGPPSLLAKSEEGPIVPASVTPEGKLFGWKPIGGELWLLSPSDVGPSGIQPELLFESRTRRGSPSLSADGRWVAYQSDETGRREVYVSPFSGPPSKFPISTDGGSLPRWSQNGKELFYRNGNKMIAVTIETVPRFSAGTPKLLFEAPYLSAYDVDADGKRFLMIRASASPQSVPDRINIVLNWTEELKRLVPTK